MARFNNRRRYVVMVAAALVLVVALVAGVGEPEEEHDMPIGTGEKAPDVTIPGMEKTIADLRGSNVLLAFYPKAFTPGCTKQLCTYRDDFQTFEDANVKVIAVSLDKQEKSNDFRAEYNLPFTVVGDKEGKLVKAFDIPSTLGFAKRSVVLIDKEGVVRYVDRAYSVGKSKDALYKAIEELD